MALISFIFKLYDIRRIVELIGLINVQHLNRHQIDTFFCKHKKFTNASDWVT